MANMGFMLYAAVSYFLIEKYTFSGIDGKIEKLENWGRISDENWHPEDNFFEFRGGYLLNYLIGFFFIFGQKLS